MDALVHSVAADKQVRPREAELLRAIADILRLPLPALRRDRSPEKTFPVS